MKLTKEELKETVFQTLGRLKIAIEFEGIERQLALWEKINNDASDMDIKIMHLERNI